MIKNTIITFAHCLVAMTLLGQIYTGPIAKPVDGYGSDGSYEVVIESFSNPNFESEDIKIYHPANVTSAIPTLFYSHAYGGNLPIHIIGLMNFIAKKGYAVVFVPYQTTGVSITDRYSNLLEGFRKAARDYTTIIDTTKVGFLGHSFGGGATIATSYTCFTENNWGINGRFIHPSAPWYSYNITQEELQNFPADTKLIMQVYDEDVVNDHRMAIDIFSTINISNDEKDFILVKSDTVENYIYSTGHDMPTSYGAYDALDYYAYYRLIDALCDYTFNGNLAGKNVALGNGIDSQIDMPDGLQNLIQIDNPIALYPETNYGFPCSSAANPRSDYCNASTDIQDSFLLQSEIKIFPNPTTSNIFIESNNQFVVSVKIFNFQGQFICEHRSNNFSIADLVPGNYLMKIEMNQSNFLQKIIVESL